VVSTGRGCRLCSCPSPLYEARFPSCGILSKRFAASPRAVFRPTRGGGSGEKTEALSHRLGWIRHRPDGQLPWSPACSSAAATYRSSTAPARRLSRSAAQGARIVDAPADLAEPRHRIHLGLPFGGLRGHPEPARTGCSAEAGGGPAVVVDTSTVSMDCHGGKSVVRRPPWGRCCWPHRSVAIQKVVRSGPTDDRRRPRTPRRRSIPLSPICGVLAPSVTIRSVRGSALG